MLCEMRGYDGSMSAWNDSHGGADSSRGLCVFRKMEVGAYVVNSNQAGHHNSYYQCENDSDGVFSHHESRHHGYPDSSWNQELRSSKTYVSQHLDKDQEKRQVERSVLRERHQPDHGSTSSHQIATAEKYSTKMTENHRISTHETETNRSTDGCSMAGNIYQGPIVRVQVPEVYYEGGSTRVTETAVAHRHNMDHERTGQHLQAAKEIYSSPVSETYRRINEWLKNCQQHSSKSVKASHVSQVSNQSKTDKAFTEDKVKQNTTSGNFSKTDASLHSQTGNISNLRPKPNEPRFIAALEPKTAKTGNVILKANHQNKHRNTDSTEKRDVSFRHDNQSSAPRNNDTTIPFSSNFNHMVNTTKPFYESGVNKTSSDWSSETLSIVESDRSSYCTDFTPFELGSADSYSGTYQLDPVSTSARECSPSVGKNVLISHVMISDRMQGKNIAQTKEFSDALYDSRGNEFAYNRRNDRGNYNSGWNTNFEQKYKQQKLQDRLTDKFPNNLTDFEASLQASKTGSVVTVFIGDSQRTQQGNSRFDTITKQSIGVQSHLRSQKAIANPANSADDTQNLRTTGRREARHSVQVPSETKLFTSDRKPIMPLRYTSLEHPLSSRFSDKDQRFSIPAHKSGYKGSSNEEDSAKHQQFKSGPVPQIRSGSLSITIRPNRLTVMDYFNRIDDVWDSSGRRVEPTPEVKGTVELSRDIESMHGIGKDTATSAKALAISDDIKGLQSGSGDDVSNESEELDEFTKTVIKADISGKVLQSPLKAEYPSKPEYNVLKLSKNLKPEISTLLAGVHKRFAGKVLDDKNTESDDEKNRGNMKEQATLECDIPLKSVPSIHESPEQPENCHSSPGWHHGKLAYSPDRDLQMKFTKNDDRFGHNSESMKCKYEDMPDTHFRSNSEKKNSEMNLLASDSVSRNNREYQSVIRNHSLSPNYRSGAITTPNGSADRIGRTSDDRMHIETASPGSMPPASDVVSDGLHSQVGPENVQRSRANKANEEDSFLISLLKSQTPDLPAFDIFSTPPRLQSRNLVQTSDLTMRSGCVGNSEYIPFKSRTVQLDREAALKSALKSPKMFERRILPDEEPSSPLTRRIYESRREGRSVGHTEEFYQQKSEETEYSRTLLNDSPDSLSSVFVDGGATPAAIPTSQNPKSDSMTRDEEDNVQQRTNCSKPSENFTTNNTMKYSEPMYCEELIDFPENLVIDPPESFSDFTIIL